MRLLILSDIHGNVTALERVLEDADLRFKPDAAVLLGDTVDYGTRSNEALEILEAIQLPVLCSLWGNHEKAVMDGDYSRFSSQRGVQSAKWTRAQLTEKSLSILEQIPGRSGMMEFSVCDRQILAVHGSLADPYWRSIFPGDDLNGYESYDLVFSGHSHQAHVFPAFFPADNPEMRNKKRTLFINPGSVGQPRNHDPRAQYAVWDSDGGIVLQGVDYDIAFEQSLYQGGMDSFYRDRLSFGV